MITPPNPSVQPSSTDMTQQMKMRMFVECVTDKLSSVSARDCVSTLNECAIRYYPYGFR